MGGYSAVEFIVPASTESTELMESTSRRIDRMDDSTHRRIDPTGESIESTNGRIEESIESNAATNRRIDPIDTSTNRSNRRKMRIDRIGASIESTRRRIDESTNGMNWSCLIFLDCPIHCFQNDWIQRHEIDTNRYSPRVRGRFGATGAKNRYAIKNRYG